MQSITYSAHICAKEKLRSEISNQVQEFLHNGGRIEVLRVDAEPGSYGRFCGKPASIDELGLHSAIMD